MNAANSSFILSLRQFEFHRGEASETGQPDDSYEGHRRILALEESTFVKNTAFIVQDRIRAKIRFTLSIGVWALAALGGICFVTAYTIRLDIAFMEANHMIRNDLLRGAIFQQVFDLEPWLFLAFPLGIIGNIVIASLFASSQDRYFRRLREAFENFSKSWVRPDLNGLGPLEQYAKDFMVLVQGEFVDGDSRGYKEIRAKMLKEWPKKPGIYWRDQIGFALLSGILACYFSALCMVIFWHANERILDLARTLTTTAGGDAPQFFLTQMDMSEFLGWGIVTVITLLSIWSGVRFAVTTSYASFACGRQLKRFLEGDRGARIVLRHGDPGRDDVRQVNEVLARLESTLRDKETLAPRLGQREANGA